MTNSKPFPNGSTCDWWDDQFCNRCVKSGECKIEDAIAISAFDDTKWPGDKIMSNSKCSWICTEFSSDDEILMRSYKALCEERAGE